MYSWIIRFTAALGEQSDHKKYPKCSRETSSAVHLVHEIVKLRRNKSSPVFALPNPRRKILCSGMQDVKLIPKDK